MMDFKERFHGSFWFNFLLVSLSFTVIYIVFFQTLSCFTHHGEMVKLPNLRGKSITEAEKILHDMHFEVQIDSTFEPTAASLAVLKQVPDSGAVVKTGRIVMLTVNSITALRVPMPNLVNLSLRSAELLLRSNKMYIGDTTYVPDIARGAVKEQRYKGEIVRPGELIPQGSKIDLIIGNGFGNQVFDVPDVVGRTVDEAMTIINQYNLIPNLYVNDIVGGMITDTFDAKIIKQTPTPLNEKGEHNKIKMGELIDLCIKQHPEPEDYNNKQIVPPSANPETTEPVNPKKINKREDE